MRTRWAIAIVVLAAGLAGCAGTSEVVERSHYNDDVDWRMVNAITEDAEQRGYKIVWVNMPQKKKTAEPAPQ
jgi:ABC-type glycerol-3-phosphate transport system substrate-binding protein